jgi:hypothetical protein
MARAPKIQGKQGHVIIDEAAGFGPESSHTEIVGNLLAIPATEIEASDRLRPIDEDWALRLGEIMLSQGQRTPIEVCQLPGRRDYVLVSGGHRHAAALLYPELPPLKALLVDANALDRREAEISENLWRKDLEPYDRASFIAELVRVQKLKRGLDPSADGRSASAAARWQDQVKAQAEDATANIAIVYGWTDEVAAKVGLSARTVRDDMMLIRLLPAGIVDRLRTANHPILRNASQLRALAKQHRSKRDQIVDLMCPAGEPSVPLANALSAIDPKPTRSAEDKRLSTFIDTFGRMSLSEKKGALAILAKLLPAGFQLKEAGSSAPAVQPVAAQPAPTVEVAPTIAEPLVPAVAIRASVKPDYIACLECGERMNMLKRHLSTHHQLSPADYLAKWKLPVDYPMVAPNYAEERRLLAKKIGLGGAA